MPRIYRILFSGSIPETVNLVFDFNQALTTRFSWISDVIVQEIVCILLNFT